MSSTPEEVRHEQKYKGVRRRKWGKWVSEIRVPGTPERLWLGSYSTPEAAAVARDVAYYCLRGSASPQNLNFPLALPAGARPGLSPRSVQRAASDAGMATDARLIEESTPRDHADFYGNYAEEEQSNNNQWQLLRQNNDDDHQGYYLNVSVEDYL